MSLLYPEESYIIRGVAFDIYKVFRNRHKEKIYQNVFYLGLKHKGLYVEREKQVKIYYSGEKVGTYTPDFVVSKKIIVELKARPLIFNEDIKRFWEYLKGSNYRLGFLINLDYRKFLFPLTLILSPKGRGKGEGVSSGTPDGVEIIRRVYDTVRPKFRVDSANVLRSSA